MELINDDGLIKIRILNLFIILEKKWWLIYEEMVCYWFRILDLLLNLFYWVMIKINSLWENLVLILIL